MQLEEVEETELRSSKRRAKKMTPPEGSSSGRGGATTGRWNKCSVVHRGQRRSLGTGQRCSRRCSMSPEELVQRLKTVADLHRSDRRRLHAVPSWSTAIRGEWNVCV
ncbi:hypothetical protein M6B38_226690 [Iris pallida]|uniref:Uncharacterized protein n=1 Tax=Iris pallida TaxID=29817 RepID=A0AAX6DUN0_IRIPA|nr:hypothetical protein M6B38_226690 [Iris pallida]